MSTSIVARLKLARDDFTLDVDLHLPGRGISALFGHSGSGKTSCLRCLAGLERAGSAYMKSTAKSGKTAPSASSWHHTCAR